MACAINACGARTLTSEHVIGHDAASRQNGQMTRHRSAPKQLVVERRGFVPAQAEVSEGRGRGPTNRDPASAMPVKGDNAIDC